MNDRNMFQEDLEEILIRHEGLRLKPYRDTEGKLTIGVGRNLDDVGLSKDEALCLLRNDIDMVVRQCLTDLSWYDQLSEKRKLVIAGMVFNMGWGRFIGFKKTLQYIESGDYMKASEEMLDSKWARQVGARAVELSEMMKEG